jgi:hypothetical protein
VTISAAARRNGPRSVGKLVMECRDGKNQTVRASGEFEDR